MPGIIGIFSDASENTDDTVMLKMQKMIAYKDWHIASPIYHHNLVTIASVSAYKNNIGSDSFLDGDINIWVEGEIHNHKNKLSTPEHDSMTSSTNIIFDAYIGNNFKNELRLLNGNYTAVIYDKKKAKLYLVTDRYGLRHIYYTKKNNTFIFASEQKAIVSHPYINYTIDMKAPQTFIDNGYLLGNSSWFDLIELVPPGSFVSWDMAANSYSIENYFDLNEINHIHKINDVNEIVDELGIRFLNAVKRCVRDNERIGIGLSGGLDSRALLAAADYMDIKPYTYTFGCQNSEEIRIARKVANKIKVQHEAYVINKNNWLKDRPEAIYWVEGVPSINNLHNLTGIDNSHANFDVKLDGFLGDATIGGTYLEYKNTSEIELILNRGRRRIISGPKRELNYYNVRLPFFDNDFFELAMSIPQELRRNSYIYRKMLLKYFPNLFKKLPCLNTGLPINDKRDINIKRLRLYNNFYRTFKLKLLNKTTVIADYPNYMRVDPAKSFISELLDNNNVEYKKYIDQNIVIKNWNEHLSGINRMEFIGRVVTLELWLRRLKDILS